MADASEASLGMAPPSVFAPHPSSGRNAGWSLPESPLSGPTASRCCRVCVSGLRIPWDFVDRCGGPIRFQFSGLG